MHFAHIDGRTNELSTYLAAVNPGLSLQGIVLAGMVRRSAIAPDRIAHNDFT